MKKKKKCGSELRIFVNREMGLGSHSLFHFPPSLISHTVSVDVKPRGKRRRRKEKEKKRKKKKKKGCGSEFRICVNREMGLDSHIPYPTLQPVPNN